MAAHDGSRGNNGVIVGVCLHGKEVRCGSIGIDTKSINLTVFVDHEKINEIICLGGSVSCRLCVLDDFQNRSVGLIKHNMSIN